MNLSRAARALLAGALTTAIVAAGAPADAAEGGSYDITSIRANNVVVRSSNCMNVPFTVTYRTGASSGDFGPRQVYFNADIEVWRGGTNLDSTYVYTSDVRTTAPTLSLRDYYVYCPSFEGLGTIRLGPSQVEGESYDDDYNTIDADTFLDRTTGSYVARQASAAGFSIGKVKGKPRLRRFNVRPQFFSLASSSWRNWANKPVALQRSTGTGWTYVRTIRSNKKGVGSVRLRVARGGKYRVVVPAASTVWAATSVTRTAP